MSAAGSMADSRGVVRHLTEERFFDVPAEHAFPVIREAIEDALDIELEELTDGMWEGRIEGKGSYQLVTVRAMPMEQGTNVEISIGSHGHLTSIALWITALVFLSMLIIPLFVMIPRMQRAQLDEAKKRLVRMHTTWREVSAALGAPMRSGYREAPRRIYAPRREHEEDREAEREANAIEEQESAERETKRNARV